MTEVTSKPLTSGPTGPRLDVTAGARWCVSRVILVATLMLVNLSCDSSPSSPIRKEEPNDLPKDRAWSLIQAEVRRLAELPPASDGNEMRQRLGPPAKIIAAKLGRADIERMLLTADKALPSPDRDPGPGLTAWLSGMVIAHIADPNDEHLLVSRSHRWGVDLDWHALAMAAIDLYHDEAAFRLLLKLGLDDSGEYGMSAVDHWASPAVEALGFLRGYDSNDNARADVEQHLGNAIRRSKQDGVAAGQAALRAKYLKALIASWDYAKGLDESRRKEYQEFERRLWTAWSLSRGGFRGMYGQFLDAAKLFRWREGDEGFLLHIFESPASTPEEVLLAEYMAPRLSEDGKRRLRAMASDKTPGSNVSAAKDETAFDQSYEEAVKRIEKALVERDKGFLTPAPSSWIKGPSRWASMRFPPLVEEASALAKHVTDSDVLFLRNRLLQLSPPGSAGHYAFYSVDSRLAALTLANSTPRNRAAKALGWLIERNVQAAVYSISLLPRESSVPVLTEIVEKRRNAPGLLGYGCGQAVVLLTLVGDQRSLKLIKALNDADRLRYLNTPLDTTLHEW